MRKVQLMIKQEEVAPATTSDLVLMNNGRTLKEELSTHPLDKFSSTQTVTTPIEEIVDGAYDGVYESGMMYGRSLVNLSSLKDEVVQTNSGVVCREIISGIKQNTAYTLIVKVKSSNPLTNIPGTSFFRIESVNSGGGVDAGLSGVTGDVKTHYTTFSVTFTTKSDSQEIRLITRNAYGDWGMTSNTMYIKEVMIIEGNHAGKDIPYFEGICDVKMPILHNLSGGACSIHSLEVGTISGNAGANATSSGARARTKGMSKLNGANSVLFSDNLQGVEKYLFSYDSSGKYLGRTPTNWTTDCEIQAVEGAYYYRAVFMEEPENLPRSMFIIPKGCKVNTLRSPEIVTLRSLPNGVRDELNLMTGEYIQRIGETVLDGSEGDWVSITAFNKTNVFRKRFSVAKNDVTSYDVVVQNFICDRLPILKYRTYETANAQTVSFSSLYNDNTYNDTAIYINRNSSSDLVAFKQWLSENPVTIQYELKTPIITKVTLTQSEPIVKIGTELPNGVCDTYNLLTGEHIQRVGKVVLDGSEDWQSSGIIMQGYTGFWLRNLFYSNNEICLCDNFESSNFSSWSDGAAKEFITYNTIQNDVCIRILSSRLSLNTLDGFKQWLKENPTTVWYELANPIITKKNGFPDTQGVTLPSGMMDKYDESTGVYTQNVGKVVLDGSEDEEWAVVSSLNLTNTIAFQYLLIQKSSQRSDNLICNGFTVQEGSSDIEHIRSAWAEDEVYRAIALFIDKTKLATQDVSGLKQYLTSNPVEIYYPLATPKTIDIPLINVGQVLPNGVCDTYNPITKEYVKRVNKVVLDGEEEWSLMKSPYETDCIGFVTPYSLANWTQSQANLNVVCEGYVGNYELWNVDSEGFSVFKTPTRLAIKVKRSKLSSEDVSGFKKLLKLIPLTVWYELATPETSFVDIDLSTLYSGVPVAYKNGHILLESGHEGQSLLPELTYSVPTSKTGVLSTTSKTILKHEERLSSFEKLLLRESVMMDYRLARSIFNEL